MTNAPRSPIDRKAKIEAVMDLLDAWLDEYGDPDQPRREAYRPHAIKIVDTVLGDEYLPLKPPVKK